MLIAYFTHRIWHFLYTFRVYKKNTCQSTQVCEDDLYDAYDSDDDTSYVTAIEDLIESPEERAQIENDILQFIAEFMEENVLGMSSPDFLNEVVEATMDAY